MPKFEIEFSYTMSGVRVVEATSKEEAEEFIDSIPTNELGAEYLDDSFSFDKIVEVE